MNKTFSGLIIKLIATFLATWIAFGVLEDNPFRWLIIVAIVCTIMNFIIGDLLILTSFGNVVATISDGILACILAYIVDLISDDFYTTSTSLLVFFIIISVFEYFLHKYLASDDRVVKNQR
ncbi:MAG: hypothetical protein K0Q49_2451 [Haloplasmataceae bacterium]|jgi:hypothetical protein|nr:hypothetical protein [Haloplasmataceae bacterium]